MLELKDFLHLPQLDALIDQLAATDAGLIIVAGSDPHQPDSVAGFLPSGRAAVFRILMRQIMEANPAAHALVVAAHKEAVRLPRHLRRRVQFTLVRGVYTYEGAIAQAIKQRPSLLVIDQLNVDTAVLALEAAHQGLCVLAPLDTIFRGADVARVLLEWGASQAQLAALRWVVAVQRLPMLCPHCRQPVASLPAALTDRLAHYPDLAALPPAAGAPTFYQAAGCEQCEGHGRGGHGRQKTEVTAFDIFRAPAEPETLFAQTSLLSLEEYVLRLAAAGHLCLDDALNLESDQLRRTYNLLTASEHALRQTNRTLQAKLLELEAANHVLQQRTEALISLQEMGQALISTQGLAELAHHVCRHTYGLCDADRAVLYYLRSEETADILAFTGWDKSHVTHQVAATEVFDGDTAVTPFHHFPPGIAPHPPAAGQFPIRAGLRLPLIAQDAPVGVMIVHTTQHTSFAPGKVALLQTFANQAALAIQRAGLITTLQDHIHQLEAAQTEIVKKERLEQELDLARQVQESMLPRIFPLTPGYSFAARNRPARHVGGDFYDVILLDADAVGLVIGDVSDKGMPSALYMALTRSLIFAEARRERSPARVLQNVHRLLLALGESNMFVTVFYGVVDMPARHLTYARAGHDYPLLLRQGVVQRLGGNGLFLGFPGVDDLQLSEEALALEMNDRLVLYTDGLTDVVDEHGRLFSPGQLFPIIQQHAHQPLPDFCQAIFADLETYQGNAEQYDDMTLLVVEIT
ncbi:MAG: SpoIIE family protein phosphatase [Anaerolineae bacterium]|nr:SpoIIE family protein phosphatase [Anaerolineae bacterium]